MHIAARKPLYEKLHPETKQGKAPAKRSGKGGKLKSQNENLTFITDTAAKTGKAREPFPGPPRRSRARPWRAWLAAICEMIRRAASGANRPIA
jgi:hypothetical protein